MNYFFVIGFFLLFLFLSAILWLRSTCAVKIELGQGKPDYKVMLFLIKSTLVISYKQGKSGKLLCFQVGSFTFLKWRIKEKVSHTVKQSEKKISLYKRVLKLKNEIFEKREVIQDLFNASDIETFEVRSYLSWKNPALTGILYGLYYMFSGFVPKTIIFQIIPTVEENEAKCLIFLKYHFYFFNFLNILLSYRKKQNLVSKTLVIPKKES